MACIFRHLTAATMVRSAARRSTDPAAPLEPSDYPQLPTFPADTSLLEAARLIVETGWALAVVLLDEPHLITPRSVLRSLLLTSGPPDLRSYDSIS